MNHLTLIRHGETEWNSDGKIQGSVDVPLSAAGLRQAAELASRLRGEGERFDLLYSSDLLRAAETARILAQELEAPPPRFSPLLRELDCGDWEGRRIEDLKREEPELYERWLGDPAFRIPGGESMLDLRGRAAAFLEEQETGLDGAERVLIVAHGLINRMFLSLLLKLDVHRSRFFSQDNTAINRFTWHGGRVYCDAWNLTCHL
jgi:probable phosphoglycerate mutase